MTLDDFAPMHARCDIPWGPCACRLDSRSLYVRRDKRAFTDFAAVPFSYKSPMAFKRAWAAAQWATGEWSKV